MRLIQLAPNVAYGDAIGNEILAIKRMAAERGLESVVYAAWIDSKHGREAAPVRDFDFNPAPSDLIIYHMSTASPLMDRLRALKCRKAMIYHNVTPPGYFYGYNYSAYSNAANGLKQLGEAADIFDFCIADSEFNRRDLIALGYRCPIYALPVLVDFARYRGGENAALVKRCRDGLTNLLFVGRVAPNKRHEDVIETFYYYQKYYNPKSRLILAGSYGGFEHYQAKLAKYAGALGAQNVVFAGRVKDEDIRAYYRAADAFVCMSAHEGFCVPLLEAMTYDIPVVALDASAVGETLGKAGILLKEREPLTAAGAIERLMKDTALREAVLRGQRERLKDFDYGALQQKYAEVLFGA